MRYVSLLLVLLFSVACSSESCDHSPLRGTATPLIEETIADLLPLVGEGDSIELSTRQEQGKSILHVEIPVDEGNRDGQISRMLGVLENKKSIELRERLEANGNSVFIMEIEAQ